MQIQMRIYGSNVRVRAYLYKDVGMLPFVLRHYVFGRGGVLYIGFEIVSLLCFMLWYLDILNLIYSTKRWAIERIKNLSKPITTIARKCIERSEA